MTYTNIRGEQNMEKFEAVQKQIEENVKELKVRAEKNQAALKKMEGSGFSELMKSSLREELSRIAGMIDTYTSCYQMLND